MFKLFRRTTLIKSARFIKNRPITLSRRNLNVDTVASGTNAEVIDALYNLWKQDPSLVDPSWHSYFTDVERIPLKTESTSSDVNVQEEIKKHVKVLYMIRNFRILGHLAADLDPLGLTKNERPPQLNLSYYGFTEADLDKEFAIAEIAYIDGKEYKYDTLRNIYNKLNRVYCQDIGYEFNHISDPKEKEWLREKIEENDMNHSATKEEITNIFYYIAKAQLFEEFLKKKFGVTKRFGLEGGEPMIAGLNAIFEKASDLGVENIVLGMPHRGRLNVLANLMQKPLRSIFHDFNPVHTDEKTVEGTGDVKYHMGTSLERDMKNGKTLHLSLASNPSHLEAVDPVVVGKTRAKQHFMNDSSRSRVMALLIHGDAAFAGQGVVAETFSLSNLRFYTTGGTVHVVVNNQIGFTTNPKDARSSRYCSDVAKMVGAPIFHVNSDNPIAVHNVCKLAAEYRQKFKKDVVIDVVCYRKHGHNEADEPAFTNPEMYKVIRKMKSPLEKFESFVIENNYMTKEETEEIKNNFLKTLDDEWEAAKDYIPTKKDWLEKNWKGFKSMSQLAKKLPTWVPKDTLIDIGLKITEIPEGFNVHRGIKKIYEQRREMIKTGKGIDWAMAEALCFGSLVNEGYPVRLSGQDSERGTFSHRHAVLYDQETYETYIPLETVAKKATFRVTNSNLSEFAILGFELGYSLEHPKILVLWEAQFGDFANGAQIIYDQFVSSGEVKWGRMSGLTMLLPHGYDGQGPEHSSARLERFLQSLNDHPEIIPDPSRQLQLANVAVVNCSLPANYFHVLRRQVCREFRKPLVVMAPKKLLKHASCKSNIEDFAEGSKFLRIIPEVLPLVPDEDVKRVIFCSGQVYYDLFERRSELGLNNVAIIRLEQIAPVPYDLIIPQLKRYTNAEIYWCQEEPMNMGAWSYISPRLETALKECGMKKRVKYVGRQPSASPATGFLKNHFQELEQFLQEAFDGLKK